MTAKCHGDNRFMDKVIEIGSVRFTHANHLKLDEKSQASVKQELEQVSKKIRAAVGDDQFQKLEQTVNEAGPHQTRIDKLVALAKSAATPVDRTDLENYSQLHHRRVRVAQLAEIQCTNCHAYSSKAPPDKTKPAHHFTVSTTSCYTCHFNNEGFNTGTNTCLMCHKQLPVGEIIVHKELTADEGQKLQSPELAAKTVKMDHQSILERTVNCIACHADVAGEDSIVTRRDCERCHDQAKFFDKWREPLTLDLVAEYHQVHVPRQRAKCLDCHSEIHHQLIPENDSSEGAFLTSVMSDCMHCHPNHHREQLSLLRGIGGTGVEKSTPNLMFGSRTNCLGCHTNLTSDAHGGNVSKAGLGGCLVCHGDRHADTFEKWKLGLELVQTDADEAYANAQKMLEEAKTLPEDVRKKVTELLTAANSDLQLVKRGNGLHNVTYAMEILDSVTTRARQASSMISEAKPAETKPAETNPGTDGASGQKEKE
jgi:hypothetical protein